MSTKKIVTSQKNRKCKAPDCKRVLSVYNHNQYCHADLNKQSREASWRSYGAEPLR